MVVAIRAARLFDGIGPLLVERPVVLVAAGRIVEVREHVERGVDVIKVMATGVR